ncbi:MAG: 2-phosphosulfolactate phosphatase [Elusimicrobiaceae bacterium]|nr:2-phosphosulfolactate phosphatase [Elusimicrobiaceae bacterium]
MKISVRSAFEQPSAQSEATVFIDVFRAATTLCYLLRYGAGEVVGAQDAARISQYRKKGYILVSEIMAGGLDNSPSAILALKEPQGRFIHSTGNFTAAVFANPGFKTAIAAAFVNAGAAARYLLARRFGSVELVMCGYYKAGLPAVEDAACAQMLCRLLRAEAFSLASCLPEITRDIETRRKSGIAYPHAYWRDVELALRCDTAEVVPVIRRLTPDTIGFFKHQQ